MHRHINNAALSYRFASPIPVITQANAIQYNPQGDGGDTALPDVSQGGDFRAIGLARLNETASMLVRRDNKYVVHQHRLAPAWPELARQFDMLEIDGKRDFRYDTCYFDDPAHTSYFDHHRGRRQRCKIRMRNYVDAQLCFAEIKLKGKRGQTEKQRIACAPDQYGRLDPQTEARIRAAYRDLYARELTQTLEPIVSMRYRRMTLVAKEGGERMTIDRSMVFMDGTGTYRVGEELVIVETKSGNANGIADKILRALHQHPTNSASKYCVSLAALRKVSKYNKLLPALRKLDAVPTRDTPPT
ncbi:polyphosphate polymerase domain-containing protein [Xanthomonas campestris pv. campestris]|uniref:polyphosphate polymerase domain-containing protein n=1 Tax=Xanthomonas campestris TaxID=339 RepID=UPI00237945F0|nr:polyphosphate polymerase domain-containing protein [Xanthomonas campestris]MDO0862568.1 polyphosphate polymerase domain-containing protein [Xanthomonas campestris pv. campestris]MEB1201910.1 polyphosphate polymerase domain-containing protein [Xanthomonas campestris pv. campestris]MEB1239325.1 polyphosphate polymerase domain-containing protein [Xanthomonas campestris pv. campestris]MEB1483837.1 polyphosphate polymerase domain-containing protein [Xanthomonas campestris pv. campestris]MEB15038